jgi:hypothetical protein
VTARVAEMGAATGPTGPPKTAQNRIAEGTSLVNAHEPSPGGESAGVSRRGFLGATAVTGSAAVVTALAGAAPAEASARTSLAAERAMIIQVAQAGSLFPIKLPQPDRLPALGLTLSDYRPASMAGLLAAERRMPPQDLRAARAGADALIAAGLLSAGHEALLDGIGRQAAAGQPLTGRTATGQTAAGRRAASAALANGAVQGQGELLAAVALAIATVFPSFEPTSGRAAQAWTSMLARKYRWGTLQSALRERGIA